MYSPYHSRIREKLTKSLLFDLIPEFGEHVYGQKHPMDIFRTACELYGTLDGNRLDRVHIGTKPFTGFVFPVKKGKTFDKVSFSHEA